MLCHDPGFARLALEPDAAHAARPVGALGLRDVLSLRLASGGRAPTLAEVLASARALSSPATRRLIVELKAEPEPGEGEAAAAARGLAAARALVALLVGRPDLGAQVELVMSFDAPLCRAFKRAAVAALGAARAPRVLLLSELPARGAAAAAARAGERLLRARFFAPARYFEGGEVEREPAKLLDEWLRCDDGGEGGGLRLDGIYVEYERGMLATPETRARLAALRAAAGGVVGVWAHPHQPDDTLRVARALVDAGVTYVNTDFQAAFLG